MSLREREEIYFPLFEDVTKAAAGGMIDYGVVPIENSSTGGITEVYDLIRGCGCAIVGEELVKIEHHLLGLPGAEMEDIDTVYSHPQGFAQCRFFFNEHRDWKLKPYFSTSQSAERVSKDGKKNQAAVASRTAAKLYGLSVLKENIFFNELNMFPQSPFFSLHSYSLYMDSQICRFFFGHIMVIGHLDIIL